STTDDIAQYLKQLLKANQSHLSLAFNSASSPIKPSDFTQIACFYAGAPHSLVLENPQQMEYLIEALVKHPLSIVCGDSKTWFKFLRAHRVPRENLPYEKTADLSLLSYLLNSTSSKHDMKTLMQKKLEQEYPEALSERAQAHLALYQYLSDL